MWKSDKPLPPADDDKGDFSRGVRRLCGAVMLQTISDMTKGALIDSYSALCWVKDGDHGALTFKTCCEVLDRDVEGTRHNLVELYGPGVEWDMTMAKAEAAKARDEAKARARKNAKTKGRK